MRLKVRRLNLGAGNRLLKSCLNAENVNHDCVRHRPEIDVVHDLNELPWPWPDSSFDFIEAWSVFEHLRINLLESMAECWRILAPDGKLHVKLPLWDVDMSWVDPTHYWKFALRSLDVFDPETERGRKYEFYTPYKWKFIVPSEKCSHSSLHAIMTPRKDGATA